MKIFKKLFKTKPNKKSAFESDLNTGPITISTANYTYYNALFEKIFENYNNEESENLYEFSKFIPYTLILGLPSYHYSELIEIIQYSKFSIKVINKQKGWMRLIISGSLYDLRELINNIPNQMMNKLYRGFISSAYQYDKRFFKDFISYVILTESNFNNIFYNKNIDIKYDEYCSGDFKGSVLFETLITDYCKNIKDAYNVSDRDLLDIGIMIIYSNKEFKNTNLDYIKIDNGYMYYGTYSQWLEYASVDNLGSFLHEYILKLFNTKFCWNNEQIYNYNIKPVSVFKQITYDSSFDNNIDEIIEDSIID